MHGLLASLVIATPYFKEAVDIPIDAVLDIDIGERLGCAATHDGEVVCWRLERRFAYDAKKPPPPKSVDPVRLITIDDLDDVVEVAVMGDAYVCGRAADGEAVCWEIVDDDDVRERRRIDEVVSIDAGPHETCAARVDGRVSCWNLERSWERVEPQLSKIAQVFVGEQHGCALSQSGEVICWGSNQSGQLGVEELDSGTVELGQLSQVATLSVAQYHSCALRSSGQVLCWGRTFHAEEPQKQSEMRVLETTAPWRALSTTTNMTCGVRNDGLAECWHPYPGYKTLWTLAEQTMTRQIAVSASQVCTLSDQGSVRCWANIPLDREQPPKPTEPFFLFKHPATLSTRLALGGGAVLTPARMQEGVFDLALRVDLLFGYPGKDDSAWGIGPLLDLRSADFDTFETGGGLLGYVKFGRVFSILLGGGAGWAVRGDESGGYGFATLSLGHRSPLDDRWSDEDSLLYSPNIHLYVDVRWGIDEPLVRSVTAGIETEPILILGAPIAGVYQLVKVLSEE